MFLLTGVEDDGLMNELGKKIEKGDGRTVGIRPKTFFIIFRRKKRAEVISSNLK